MTDARAQTSSPTSRDKPPSTRSAAAAWLFPILVNVVAPILTYTVLAGAGMGDVPALLVSGLWPLVDTVVELRRQGRVDEFAVFALVGLGAGILTTLFSDSARAVFLKDSIASAVIGLAFLVTLPWKPLTFYLGRRFATDGSTPQRDWWDGLWAYPRFRYVQRRLCAQWGIVLVVESALRAVLTYKLGAASMVVVNNVLPYLVIGAMVWVSVGTGAREQRRAESQGHDNAAPPPAQPA